MNLRSRIVNPSAANTGTGTVATGTSIAALAEVFDFNPYAMDINLTTTEGSKL